MRNDSCVNNEKKKKRAADGWPRHVEWKNERMRKRTYKVYKFIMFAVRMRRKL